MKVLFYYTDAGDKVANNDAYIHGNLLVHTEFHRVAAVITIHPFNLNTMLS